MTLTVPCLPELNIPAALVEAERRERADGAAADDEGAPPPLGVELDGHVVILRLVFLVVLCAVVVVIVVVEVFWKVEVVV